MYKPKAIYYEKNIEDYELGKQLIKQYEDVPKIIIDNHNNIEEMRRNPNSEFLNMKRNIIIGVRKTHNFVPNYKTSDFLVPYTSSRLYSCLYVLLFSV